MALLQHDTVDADGTLVFRDTWSNGTQAGDPAAGYARTDGVGATITSRPLSASESAMLAAADSSKTKGANRATLTALAQSAVASNATYLARGTTSTTQDKAQIAMLTRECSAVIKLLLGLVDDLTGT